MIIAYLLRQSESRGIFRACRGVLRFLCLALRSQLICLRAVSLTSASIRSADKWMLLCNLPFSIYRTARSLARTSAGVCSIDLRRRFARSSAGLKQRQGQGPAESDPQAHGCSCLSLDRLPINLGEASARASRDSCSATFAWNKAYARRATSSRRPACPRPPDATTGTTSAC